MDFLLKPFSILINKKFPKEIKKIIIVKPDHLGDVLLTTSVFRHIKERFPDALIDIVCGEWALPIFENNPFIRKIFIVNVPFANRKNIPKITKLIEFLKTYINSLIKIRKEGYDIGLFLRARRGNLISLAVLGNIKYTIGHGTAGFGCFLSREVEWGSGKHEIEHFMEVLKEIGIQKKLSELRPELYPDKAHKELAMDCYKNLKIKSRMAIIHPGSGNPQKTLSIEKWQRVVSILEKKGYDIVITGSASEEKLALEISEGKENVKVLSGKFDVLTLYEFFKLAGLIVTVDSLSSHLAGLTDVETYVFYSGLGDINQWKALGENIRILKNECPASPCEGKCSYNYACMDFDVERIFSNI